MSARTNLYTITDSELSDPELEVSPPPKPPDVPVTLSTPAIQWEAQDSPIYTESCELNNISHDDPPIVTLDDQGAEGQSHPACPTTDSQLRRSTREKTSPYWHKDFVTD